MRSACIRIAYVLTISSLISACSETPITTVDASAGDASGIHSDSSTSDDVTGDRPSSLDVSSTDSGPRDVLLVNDRPFARGPDGELLPIDETCRPSSCNGRVTLCTDCIDNDTDGRVDSRDPECLGPCDNTEGAGLLAGVGGETGGQCRADCYFDFGNGGGGGDCAWDHRCDPLSISPTFDPEGAACRYEPSRVGTRDCPTTQPSNCESLCKPLTPNGCDCFGCCTFPAIAGRTPTNGGEWVWLGSVVDATNTSSCTLADVGDRTKCRPCTPVANCLNTCERCELCLGKTSLPADCVSTPSDAGVISNDGAVVVGDASASNDAGSTPSLRCPTTETPCGLPGESDCAAGYYCVTGCCKSILF